MCVFSDRTMALANTAAAEDACPFLLEKKHAAGTPSGKHAGGISNTSACFSFVVCMMMRMYAIMFTKRKAS